MNTFLPIQGPININQIIAILIDPYYSELTIIIDDILVDLPHMIIPPCKVKWLIKRTVINGCIEGFSQRDHRSHWVNTHTSGIIGRIDYIVSFLLNQNHRHHSIIDKNRTYIQTILFYVNMKFCSNKDMSQFGWLFVRTCILYVRFILPVMISGRNTINHFKKGTLMTVGRFLNSDLSLFPLFCSIFH